MTAAQTWTGPAPDDITAWTLVQAGHAVGRRITTALAEAGLSPTQFGTLLNLDLRPGMSNGEIARTVLVTPQSMSELLGSLERLGLIVRPPAGRGHRAPARLTPAGQETLVRCAQAMAGVEAGLGLAAGERQRLNRSLHKILAAG